MPQADDGDHWDVHRPETDVVSLAIWCSAVGFCFGYWVVDTVPVRAAIVCAALIGVILGRYLGRSDGPSPSRDASRSQVC